MKRMMILSRLPALFAVVVLTGCFDDDQYRQVAEVSQQAADRQAQQNTEVARVNREVAEGTRRLVAADAEARKELVVVHQDLQAERAGLTEGFNTLEAERKEIAQQRRTESALVPALQAIGSAVAVTVVVAFCLLVLLGLGRSDASDAELNDLLIRDLVSEQSQLLSRPENSAPAEVGSLTPRLGLPVGSEKNRNSKDRP